MAEHTGAMIALVPRAADAARLALEVGEVPEELHITLCYLGEAAAWNTQEREDLLTRMVNVFTGRTSVIGDAFAPAYFNVANDDIDTALVYLVGGEPVANAHRAVSLNMTPFGDKVPKQHKPWVAHVTAAYTDDQDAHKALVPNMGRVVFDRIRVAFGDEVSDLPLMVLPEDMEGLVAAMGVYAPATWNGPLAPIGAPTGDKRIFAPGAIGQASFPQPFRWQERGMPGHTEAVTVGSITDVWIGEYEGTPHIMGEGYFLNPDIIPEVTKAIHLIENGVTGPSVDLDSFTAGVGEYDGKPILVVTDARQRGATLVSIPAFADLRITVAYPQGVDEPVGILDLPEMQVERGGEIPEGMVASGGWITEDPETVARVEEIVASAAPGDWVEYVPGAGDEILATARENFPGIQATRGGIRFPMATEPVKEFATTKTQGWHSAPIAPRDADFDADDAVKRIEAWAGIGTDEADESKFRSMFLWAKPEALDKYDVPLGRAGYRLPWGDIFDGKPYLVYHAVYAGAALIEGGHGGLPNIPDTDKNQLRNTITKIYARLSTEFNDPNIRASWDRRAEEASMEPETFTAETQDFAAQFAPLYPSKKLFAKRDLKGPTKPVVTADGQYYGHIALWETCHLSYDGVCVTPVASKVDYKHFDTGTVLTAESEVLGVGKILFDGLHAATRRGMTAYQVKKFYEDTSKVGAIARLYSDEFGIQASGVCVPEMTPELAQKLRRSEVSAHWHPIDGNLEVVAAIAVNRPAFGIVASAATEGDMLTEGTIVLVEDGVQTGLIASATFAEEAEMGTEGTGTTEGTASDCGCGVANPAGELRVQRIMGLQPLPTMAELADRQSRLSRHLGA